MYACAFECASMRVYEHTSRDPEIKAKKVCTSCGALELSIHREEYNSCSDLNKNKLEFAVQETFKTNNLKERKASFLGYFQEQTDGSYGLLSGRKQKNNALQSKKTFSKLRKRAALFSGPFPSGLCRPTLRKKSSFFILIARTVT